MSLRCRDRRVFALLVLVALSGCGTKKMVPVKGLVKLDGAPLAGATIRFIGTDGGTSRPMTGISKSDGTFQMTTFASNDGVPPGEYRVIVTKTEGKPDPKLEEASSEGVPAHYKRRFEEKPMPPGLPAIYGDPAKTPLKCTVPTVGPLPLDLESNPMS